jgi:hypothetical protein
MGGRGPTAGCRKTSSSKRSLARTTRAHRAAAVAREAEQEQAHALLTARVGELEAQLAVALADRNDADRRAKIARWDASTGPR